MVAEAWRTDGLFDVRVEEASPPVGKKKKKKK